MLTETQIQNYETEKMNLETMMNNLNKEKIILEEQLKQQQEILLKNFNTTDPVELNKIAENFQNEILQLQNELKELELSAE